MFLSSGGNIFFGRVLILNVDNIHNGPIFDSLDSAQRPEIGVIRLIVGS